MSAENLDGFLAKQPSSVHHSARKLARTARQAYPIGVPALIMKSNTDRLTTSSGYSFILGTPDDLLRRLASWLLTNAVKSQVILLKLIKKLWKRHGREDVALASILLANIDHSVLSIEPWRIFENLIQKTEPIEGLLLCIEELLRAKHQLPSTNLYLEWLGVDSINNYLAMLTCHAGMVRGVSPNKEVIKRIELVKIPDGDSILSRIKSRLTEK